MPRATLLATLLDTLDVVSPFHLKASGALKEDGWFRSFREKASIDADGNPLPWITYPAIDFLARRIRPEMTVFEYGSGGSTRWWASRVSRVVSCEHDAAWYQKVRRNLPENAELHHVPLDYGGDYCQKILAYESAFDLVVVDGRDRINCAVNALTALKPDGVVIWDNSERSRYAPGFKALEERGFKKLEFTGMCPMSTNKTETGIFYRPDNCLGI